MGALLKELTGLVFARHSVRIAWLIAILLLVIGYLTPPLGAMPEWVLPSIGWAFAFAGLSAAIGALEAGLGAHFKKGDIELHITKEDE